MSTQPPTGKQIQQLRDALLNAFTLDELRQLVRLELNADLERLVPTLGQNGEQIAYNLVRAYASQPGGFGALLRAGLAQNPTSPALQQASLDFGDPPFAVLPLPEALTPYGDVITVTIGDNVRNVAIGKNITQTIVEGDQITNYILPGDEPPLYVNVPALPQHFLGRDALLDELAERLCKGQTTALSADGLPGVGKTTLAIALARRRDVLAHFRDGVLWAGLGRSPDVASIQATWAEQLGASITDTADPSERMRRINVAIGLRRLLLVLDDAWQAEPLDHLRTTGPNVAQILTTRDRAIARRFAGAAQEVTVPVLAEEPSHALLRTLAPEAWDADPTAAAALADRVGGLPLALELLGGYLAEPERHLFPELSEAAFTELADPATRLQLAQVRLGSVTGKRQTLAETIALSLEELAQVKPEAVETFHALGAFAPKPARFDLDAAKVVTGAGAATLALLIARSLLEQEAGELTLHQTLSDVARTKANDEAAERHRDYYLALASDNREEWRRVEALYPQITQAWQQVGRHDGATVAFVDALSTYQTRRGLWPDRLAWLAAALDVARTADDRQAQTRMLHEHGYVHDALGDKQQALAFYNQPLPLQREAGDKGGEATTLNNIGGAHDALGDKQQALALAGFRRQCSITS